MYIHSRCIELESWVNRVRPTRSVIWMALDMKIGLWVSGIQSQYIVKQLGRQVTDPKRDSNDFAKLWDKKYS